MLKDADCFDHAFFRISERDAELMDPQHRLLLEIAWNSLEDAAINPSRTESTIGVYACVASSDYYRLLLASGRFQGLELEQVLLLNGPEFCATRVSYKLGLSGPAVSVLTACSSSLVAVHTAVQALRNGDCDTAVVCAATAYVPVDPTSEIRVAGGIESPTGFCRPFDAQADGTLNGSAAASVVLRLASDATRDGDPIRAVIVGSAINNDGSRKVGYTAPSLEGQEGVISKALADAAVPVDTIGYLETHGTGTHVGDPIEWSAASRAYSAAGADHGTIAVGALKGAIGHTDATAGVAGLIKATFVVGAGVIPAVAGFETPSPLLEPGPLFVPRGAQQWTGPTPRRAGVSAFGIGGTNAHIVIEAPPPLSRAIERDGTDALVFPLSAHDEAALEDLVALVREAAPRWADLPSVASTLVNGRASLTHRVAWVATHAEQFELAPIKPVESSAGRPFPAPLIWMFPGQGSERMGMGCCAFDRFGAYRRAFRDCLSELSPPDRVLVEKAVLGEGGPQSELFASTRATQLALFVHQFSLAAVLRELSMTPSAVVGHSLGELTAACVAGAIELPDAIRLVIARGEAMESCAEGSMLAVAASETEVASALSGARLDLEVAATNGPDSHVVAGPIEAVTEFERRNAGNFRTARLRSTRAFHSRFIEPALPGISAAELALARRPLNIPLISNQKGEVVEAGLSLEPDHFTKHARARVRFYEGIVEAQSRWPGCIAIEVGAGTTLSGMAATGMGLPAFPTDTEDAFLEAVAVSWVNGHSVDLGSCVPTGTARTHLPVYPFRRVRHWARELSEPEAERTAMAREEVTSDAALSVEETTKTRLDSREVLRAAWSELLGTPPEFDDEDDFFDLGADSFALVRLARRLRDQLGEDVSSRSLLATPNFGEQVALIESIKAQAECEGCSSR